jgi:prevent-host-death family protein
MSVTNIHQAKTNLSKLIEAAERGEEVIIARNGKPAVRIVPVASPVAGDTEMDTPGKRIAGMFKGELVLPKGEWWKNDDEFIDLFYDVSKFEKNPDAA